MDVRTKCPHCSAVYRVAESFHQSGAKVKCKRCRRPFKVTRCEESNTAVRPPVEEQDALEDLAQREHRSAATRECPSCAETIKAAAKKCRFCGEILEKSSSGNLREPQGRRRAASIQSAGLPETLGWVLIAVPIVGTMLVWFWVGNMNLFQNPASNLTLIVFATVILTSIFMAVEASQLGMGRIEFNGKRGTSPTAWLFAGLLFWIVAYPAYLRTRLRYGLASRLLVGSFVAVLFAGSAVLMSMAIEAQKADVRNTIDELKNVFGGG